MHAVARCRASRRRHVRLQIARRVLRRHTLILVPLLGAVYLERRDHRRHQRRPPAPVVTYTSHLSGCHGQASIDDPERRPLRAHVVRRSRRRTGDVVRRSGRRQGLVRRVAPALRLRREGDGPGERQVRRARRRWTTAPMSASRTRRTRRSSTSRPRPRSSCSTRSSAGWSDHLAVTVTQVASSTPLGAVQRHGR